MLQLSRQYLPYPAPIVLTLDTATQDKEYDFGGNGIILVGATGTVSVRLNERENPLINLNQLGTVIGPFYRLFITWTAQAGKVATLVLTNGFLNALSNPTAILVDSSGLLGTPMQASQTPTVYNVTMTLQSTEYSLLLPVNCKRFQMHVQDDSAGYQVAFVTGKVAGPTAPYINVLVGGYYYETDLTLPAVTLYFACASAAGKIMEIIAWT